PARSAGRRDPAAFPACNTRAVASPRNAASATAPVNPWKRLRRSSVICPSVKLRRILSRSGRPDLARDEAGAALVGEVRPRPLHHDDAAVAEADEVEDVHEAPQEPGNEAGEAQAGDLGDRLRPPDDRHRALVDVVERPSWMAGERREDIARRR